MKLGLALIACSVASAQSPKAADPKEIIRKSVDHDLVNFERLKNYTYTERDDARAYDKRGKLAKSDIETYDILILGGRDYARLIQRDDKPLPENEARKEQQKMDKEVDKREHESAADKAKIDKERQEERKFLSEVPEAFHYKLLGEETVSGKPAWVIGAEPNPEYHPEGRVAKIVTKLRGKIWVDQGEYQWVKVDAEVIGTLSFGFHMLQVEPGATVHFEQTRVNDEIWLPANAKIYANARLLLLKQMHSEIDIAFRDYKKFQADSHVVSEGQ
jgi:hypothetical protein